MRDSKQDEVLVAVDKNVVNRDMSIIVGLLSICTIVVIGGIGGVWTLVSHNTAVIEKNFDRFRITQEHHNSKVLESIVGIRQRINKHELKPAHNVAEERLDSIIRKLEKIEP